VVWPSDTAHTPWWITPLALVCYNASRRLAQHLHHPGVDRDGERLDSIRPQKRNANRHTPRGIGQLERSIQQDGWIGAITVAADGETFDGSARVEVGVATGFEDAIVVESDGSKPVIVRRTDIATADDPRAVRLGVAANRVAQLDLDWDTDVLAGLSADGMLDGLFSTDELDALLASVGPEPGNGGDDFDTTPQDGPTRVQRGDVWRIGEHRLMCGDSTVAGDVGRLMGADRYSLLWTDPPYGVAVGDKNKYLNSIAPSNRVEENLTGDKVDEDTLVAMLQDAFTIACEYGTAGAGWYVAAPPGPLHIMFGLVLKGLGVYRQTLIWVKQNATFAPLGVDYHWRHEPIFYGWLPTGPHHAYGGRKQDTVWEIDRPQASPEHPTMKPVELVARAIENSSRRSEIVYDPFAGSGTTMIAAHRLNRKAALMDIDPHYCDVILRRAEAEGIGPIEREE
jgi:DNA modification methylase